jgi:hypothetical protein
MGHEDQFPSPGPSDRCRFSQETFRRPSGNEPDPPKPDKAGDRVLVHGPNALRLPPNITQSSGTLPVIPMLARGEGEYR